ncbi:beta-lactamase family protein [Lysobacter sp. 5GHs7-4]|uniref:serine hydrolase domain-containing protein n=1 Tax=Lysobacter sp. 5GHs7-4 TaxID=2904253 RepID=UPI001E3B4BF6|nr:serine hydrolase domain-containing protein [Lysobacter sp. 5GHs7-4]UHQ23044.1 beta-lactamase family protein [Lysobacter sp. 5GHs7-4]
MKPRDWWPAAAMGLLLLQNGHALAADGPTMSEAASTQQSDEWRRTRSGIAYLVPYGWKAESRGTGIVIAKPAEDARIAILDVDADSAEAALASAWEQYAPGNAPKLRGAGDRPLRGGWSSVRSYQYETAGPDRILRAQVLHEGRSWIVAIMDLPETAMDRREAQITRVLSSLRAKTYTPQTLAGIAPRDLDAGRIDALLRFLEEARTGLGIPGLAIGIVQNGEVKYVGGLGVRQVGSNAKVDASTRFLTASATKPLTSLMLAKLVDEKKLDWDASPAQLFPAFKLADPALSRRIQVRNLLCACTGIPPQDKEWEFSGDEMGPEDVLRVLSGVQATADIGELYQYSNLMGAAAGYLGAHIAHPELPLGAAYDRSMQERVFDPLGMRSTTFDFDLALRGNVASPHATTIDGEVALAAMGYNRASIPMRPDGGAWSDIRDMAAYLRMELASGLLPDGSRYIGAAALKERWKNQVARGGLDQWYGMGLKTDRQLGVLQVFHGGSMAGYQTEVRWLPEAGAGYVLMMNADAGAQLRGLMADRFIEVLFDVDRKTAATLKALPPSLHKEQQQHRAGLRMPLDATTLATLAPLYAHPTLGTVRVRRDGAKTWFDFGLWRTEVALADSEAGTVLESISPGVAGFQFTPTQKHGARALVLADGQRTYTFLAQEPAAVVAPHTK